MAKKLKAFDGFQLDLASELSGLSPNSINTLRRHELVKPRHVGNNYEYSFADILTLRVIKQLRDNNVTFHNIVKAHDYLKNFDTEKSLHKLQLAVRKDTGEILYVGENVVSLSRYGQLLMKNLIHVIPVGLTLEPVRQNVVELDKRLSTKPKNALPAALLLKKYAWS